MKLGMIRTRKDAINFTVFVTFICVLFSGAATSFVFKVVQPESHFEYVFNASMIALILSPVFSFSMASNILSIEKIRMELAKQAQADPLTGLMNRRALRDAVEKEKRRMERLKYEVSLILVDIDYFKHVNDVHGHIAGDLVLQSIANTLKTNVRPSMDYVARWGGEEFVILLAGTDLNGAAIAAERLRRAVETLDPSIGKVRLGVTACFGVAQLRSGQELDDVIDQADRCLYEAKNAGRNKVVTAKPDPLRAVS